VLAMPNIVYPSQLDMLTRCQVSLPPLSGGKGFKQEMYSVVLWKNVKN